MVIRSLSVAATMLLTLQATGQPAKQQWVSVKEKPMADATGMVPGDVVLGNLTEFPGHAGIYIGKWHRLPEPLRKSYKHLYNKGFISSTRNELLKDSYLVVDSFRPNVMIRPFVVQFTHYFHKGKLKTIGALKWESDYGAAMKYLDDGDMRRWRIVEEAFKMVDAGVMYPDIPRPPPPQFVRNYRQTAIEDAHLNDRYGTHDMDCISMVYVAYWRGAQMKLDTTGERAGLNLFLLWRKWLGNKRLELYEGSSMLAPIAKTLVDVRQKRWHVDFKPVYVEAALIDMWTGRPRTTTGDVTEKKPYALLSRLRTADAEHDRAKEFVLQEIDTNTLDPLPAEPLVALATLRSNNVIELVPHKVGSGCHYIFYPLSGTLYVERTAQEGDTVTTIRGDLIRSTEGLKGPPEPNYSLDVTVNRNAYRHGPVQGTVMAIRKDAKRTIGPPMVKAPYLVVVRLGQHTQYLYPANAVYPGVKIDPRGRIMRFTRFTNVHVPMLQALALPDTMTVTAILPGGERVTKTVKVFYKAEAHPDWAVAKIQYRNAERRKLDQALALPVTSRRRPIQIAKAAARLLEFTTDHNEVSKVWRTAREAIRGPREAMCLGMLQMGQMKGAWLRGDVDLYRTLVSERERTGAVDAHQILNLMIMLVRYRNDVETARSYWPKFHAAVAKMPKSEQSRLGYGQAARQTLLLPAQRIRP